MVLRTQQWSAFYEQAWLGNDNKYIAELDKLSDEGRESLERVLGDAEQKLQALHQQCAATLGEGVKRHLKSTESLRGKLQLILQYSIGEMTNEAGRTPQHRCPA
jgi:hypothetical protein